MFGSRFFRFNTFLVSGIVTGVAYWTGLTGSSFKPIWMRKALTATATDSLDAWVYETLQRGTCSAQEMRKIVSLLKNEPSLGYESWRSAALMRILFNAPAWRYPLLPGNLILSFPVSDDPADGLRLSLFTDDQAFDVFRKANPGAALIPKPASLKDIFEAAAPLLQTPNPEQRMSMMSLNPTPGPEGENSLSLPLSPRHFQLYFLVIKSEQLFRSRGQEQRVMLSPECVQELKTAPLFVIECNGSLYANEFGSGPQKLVVCTGIDVALRFIELLKESGSYDNWSFSMVSYSSIVSFSEQNKMSVAFVFDCFDTNTNILLSSFTPDQLSAL